MPESVISNYAPTKRINTRARRAAWVIGACLMLCGVNAAYGQNYPDRPVRVVTSGVGGGADVVIRLIAPVLTADLRQPVIVDNQPAGITPIQTVVKAPPDGYILLSY